jgi:hypothetical protein
MIFIGGRIAAKCIREKPIFIFRRNLCGFATAKAPGGGMGLFEHK